MQEKLYKPGLYITATPIGNYKDITLRTLEIFNNCDIIFCEDTRVTNKLLQHFDIKKPLYIYNDHSKPHNRKKIIDTILQQKCVVLVSDAGTPLISDPGYKLVDECIKNNIKVYPIPGVDSITTAISVSGLATNCFTFFGFLPSKTTEKTRLLENIKNQTQTSIFFESPHRLLSSLKLIKNILNDRKVCVARELTKFYEDIETSNASKLIEYYTQKTPKGEIVLIIQGNTKQKTDSIQNLDMDLKELLKKYKTKEAVNILYEKYNKQINKKTIYNRTLEIS